MVDYIYGFQDQSKVVKIKKVKYAIKNFSEKDHSKIIREFEKIEKLPYKKKNPKHDPTDSYFHLARYLVKCMMRSDNLNRHDHGGYTEITALPLNVNIMKEDKSKIIIVHKSLSKNCSTGVGKLKWNIINITLLQSNSSNV